MLKLVFIFNLFFLLIFQPEIYSYLDKNLLFNLSIIYIIIFLIHIFLLKNKINNWFRLDILFLFSVFISFFILPLLYYFLGFFPDFNMYTGEYLYFVNYATWIVLYSINIWMIGFHFSYNKYILLFKNSDDIYYNYKILLNISIFLFSFFIISVGNSFLSGEYNGVENWNIISRYLYSIFSITIILTSLFIIMNFRKELSSNILNVYKINKTYLSLIGIYIVIFVFIVGDRGSALELFSAILFIYSLYVKPISLKKLLFFIIVGTILMSIIGLGRNTNESILVKGVEILSENISTNDTPLIYDLTKDLSSTSRILYKTIEVTERDGYFLGKTMIAPILAIIPFLNNIFFQIIDIKDNERIEYSTSDYITYLIQGKFNLWGEGSNLFADIYINFGFYGLLVIMFILGIIFKKLHYEVFYKRNINYIIVSTILISFIIYWPRSSLFIVLKPILWALIFHRIFIIKEKVY